MRLAKVRIKGFQSFEDSGEIEFGEGINLIIGQNNAGKSALLRALEDAATDDRHRSPGAWESHWLKPPRIELEVVISGREFQDSILLSGSQFQIPIDPASSGQALEKIQMIFEIASFNISFTRFAGNVSSEIYPSHGLFEASANSAFQTAMIRGANGEIFIDGVNSSDADHCPLLAHITLQKARYQFSAERYALGASVAGNSTKLNLDASNLPSVLDTLQGGQGTIFRKLIVHMSTVFDSIGNLSVWPAKQGGVEIRVWPTEEMNEVELSFPLAKSGTGVAQVLAILTAVMTVENAVIIIDEINSFLHPAAVKSLLRILQTEYAQHQYIISTHAPEVISFANPSTVHLVTRSGYDSKVERLDLRDIEQLREVADHLGVSMADVFAAERVIWVEGATEEVCFPFIYESEKGILPRGVKMTSVVATGDLSGKRRHRTVVYEIYERVSKAAAPLVKSVLFSFDSELLPEKEQDEMRSDSGGKLRFLPRRHFECYLISPAAIADFIISKDTESSELTAKSVETELHRLAGEQPFKRDWMDDLTAEAWLATVDAATLIGKACGALTDHRLTFNKKKGSLALLQYRLTHEREQVQPLIDYVVSLVEAVATE
jgi:AAA domain/AAA domain, putative AbiEii toxin, Type IV TA system